MTTIPSLIIYWGGSVISGPFGVDYMNGYSTVVTLDKNVNFTTMCVTVKSVMGLNSSTLITKILFRKPMSGNEGALMYEVVEITDDDDMTNMYRTVTQFFGLTSIELYVEYDAYGTFQELLYRVQPSNLNRYEIGDCSRQIIDDKGEVEGDGDDDDDDDDDDEYNDADDDNDDADNMDNDKDDDSGKEKHFFGEDEEEEEIDGDLFQLIENSSRDLRSEILGGSSQYTRVNVVTRF